jgi:hypothetical protein
MSDSFISFSFLLICPSDVEHRRKQKIAADGKRASVAASRNPYANANHTRSANSAAGDCDPSTSSRTISPLEARNNRGGSSQSAVVRRWQDQQRRSPVRPPAANEGARMMATDNQQFPHRSGRVRSSRQFGGSLRIPSNQVDFPSATDSQRNHGRSDYVGHSVVGDSSDEDDFTVAKAVHHGTIKRQAASLEKSSDARETKRGSSSSGKRPRPLELHDDDDDLSLSPVVFPKKK